MNVAGNNEKRDKYVDHIQMDVYRLDSFYKNKI